MDDAVEQAMLALKAVALEGGGYVASGDVIVVLIALERALERLGRVCEVGRELSDLVGGRVGARADSLLEELCE